MSIGKIEVGLIEYGPLVSWTPKIGDMIFKDGGLFRWCCLVDGINGDNIHVRKSGNPPLLLMGDYKNEVINIAKIKHTRVGSYYVVSGSIYYV